MAENAKSAEERKKREAGIGQHAAIFSIEALYVMLRGEEEEQEKKLQSIYFIIITMVYNVDLDLCVCGTGRSNCLRLSLLTGCRFGIPLCNIRAHSVC